MLSNKRRRPDDAQQCEANAEVVRARVAPRRFHVSAAAVAGRTPHLAVRAIAQRLAEIDLGGLALYVQTTQTNNRNINMDITYSTAASLAQLLRFLVLKGGAGGRDISPTGPLDRLWHAALLFPALYAQLSHAICGLGTLIDHDPNAARDPPQWRSERLHAAVDAHTHTFGEAPHAAEWEEALPPTRIAVNVHVNNDRTLSLRLLRSMQAPAIQDLLEKILKVKVRSIRWDQPVHDKNTPLRSLIDQRAVSCDVATAAPIAWKSIDAAVMAPFASMQVFVNSSSGNTRSIDINENELVLDLKREIQVIKGFPPGQQRLMYDDNVLDNDYSLHSQEVENGSTVQLILIQCGC